jgi:uncharacterized protein (DUF433 family)
MAYERITIDDAKMGGLPCIRGLRILVSTVLGQLAAGRTEVQILADYPDLEPADIPAALEYAVVAVLERHVRSPRASEVAARGEPGAPLSRDTARAGGLDAEQVHEPI